MVEHEIDGDTNYNWCYWYSHQRIDTGTGGLSYTIIKISQNTEESPGDLERLDITQTRVRKLENV